jgi:hypothetical protein
MRLVSNKVLVNRAKKYVLYLALPLAIAACASAPPTPSAPAVLAFDKEKWETLVRERADARWKHIEKKDFEPAFDFYTAASKKDLTYQTLALNIKNMRAVTGKADTVECTPEKCDVKVNVTLTVRIPRVGNKQQIVPFQEVWIPENGSLYLIRPS